MGIIYCYTNLINGKKYVGQTINPEKRYNQHKSSAFNEKDKDYNTPLHRAFRKYGYDNFNYEIILSTSSLDILNELEIYFIDKYKTQVPNGYNILEGGNNSSRIFNEEAKINMMKAHASLTEEEVVELRIAYKEKESPSVIYNNKYKDRMHFQSFLNIWTGKRYSSIMPEVFADRGRHTKLNEEKVKQIKMEIAEGKSYRKIAENFNVSPSTIADIAHGRTWKQVTI